MKNWHQLDPALAAEMVGVLRHLGCRLHLRHLLRMLVGFLWIPRLPKMPSQVAARILGQGPLGSLRRLLLQQGVTATCLFGVGDRVRR